MLVSFSVSNYRSFDEEQTFSLVASKQSSAQVGHTVPIPDSDECVLRTAVIYGANAAGKSNVFKALDYLRQVAIGTRLRAELLNQESFLLRRTGRPTRLDIQFTSSDAHYRYTVALDNSHITDERLARVTGGSEILVFERSTSDAGIVKVELGANEGGAGDNRERIEALAKVGGPPNQSFLATVFATLGTEEWPPHFKNALWWFISTLRLIPPESPVSPTKAAFASSADLRDFAGEFLKAASTGIDGLQASEKPLSEEDVLAIEQGNDRFRPVNAGWDGISFRILPNGDVIVAARSAGEVRYQRKRIEAAHRSSGEPVNFSVEQESDGTQRLMQLLPTLHEMRSRGGCYMVDEIDRSLHPVLIHEIFKFFLCSRGGPDAQLIVTTHESSLLDLELLRRDEIWFAEKNQHGATALYSLLDFDPRNDRELRKNYLQGRFGAVPFLGGMDKLLEKDAKAG